MRKSIRLLLVEDSENDALLVLRELHRGGFDSSYERVDSREALNAALENKAWDIIISDYSMPRFNGLDALAIMKQTGKDLPFILISGTIGEEVAVTAMKAGAHDYIMKNNLTRLLPAVERELREATIRRMRKEAEESLHESQHFIQRIADSTPNIIYVYDLISNRHVYINQKIEALLGYTPGEIQEMGENFSAMLVHPEDLPKIQDQRNKLINSSDGEIFETEYRMKHANGEWRWFSSRDTIFSRSGSGRPHHSLGIAEEITEHKRAEQLQTAVYQIARATELAQSLADLFASVHDIIGTVMSTKNFYIALYNKEEDLLSFPYFVDEIDTPSPPQKLGKGLTEFVLRTGKSLLCDEAAETEMRGRGEIELIGVASLVWLGVPLKVGNTTIGVMAVQHYSNPKAYGKREQEMLEYVSTEVAKAIERKRVEEEIHKQATLLDIASDAISVCDLSGRILFWNKGAEHIYGWSEPEVLGKNGTGLLFKEQYQEQRGEAQQVVLKTGEWRGELNQITKEAKDLIVQSRWTLVRDQHGKPESILIVNTNITEKKSLEQQLLRTQRMESIGTLASGIAHDLNNILAPIALGLQILRKRVSDDNSKNIIETLEAAAARGAGMVKQVLTFARGVQGERLVLQPKHLIDEMIKVAYETFPKSIYLTTDVAKNLWTVSADATQLHQVLLNLCINARDAMPNGGTLKLEAVNEMLDEHYAQMHVEAKPGAYVVIKVSDTGLGIPQGIIDKIFDPFFTTKQIGKGTGLGLSTVLGIVKKHGGFLNVYSEVGKGTRFMIHLPAIESAESLEVEQRQAELPIGHGEVILVIDDEIAIREITRETLEAYNYEVLTASDGAEGIALYIQQKDRIRLVMTDMMMPLMGGAATIKALRKINRDVKIIAASGLSTGGELLITPDMEVQASLAKPYTADTLLVTLNDILVGGQSVGLRGKS